MEYFYSILGAMDNRLKKNIEDGVIDEATNIAIIGSDEYAFAMRTLLVHKGYRIGCYIIEDDEKREKLANSVRYAASRFFNPTNDSINLYSVEEWSNYRSQKWIFFYASKDCTEEVVKLKEYSVKDIHCLLDWKEIDNDEKQNINKKLSLDEIKNIEKDILKFFDEFCRNNNLRYWLSGGSMLGTLRHKGFIPWDDDIDVFMPDVDYKKFLELFQETQLYKMHIVDDIDDVWPHYKFVRIMDKRTYFVEKYPFYRHHFGVNLEILPIVGLPTEKAERIAYIRQYDKYNKKRRQLFFECDGNMDKFRIACTPYKPTIKDYKFDSSEYVGVLGTGYYEKDCTTREVYTKTLRLPFEDIEVNIPVGYKEYLDNLYGEGWEELPPEKDRIAKHDMEAYWI